MAGPVRSVAVLGTGIMGAPMARNMARAGLEVRAWNRTPEKAAPLAGDGVRVAGSPEDAAAGADALLTVLTDADAVAAVAPGALRALSEDGLWIQSSTVGVEGVERLAGLAAEAGVTFVDAPVVGTRQPAEEGQLLVLAAGPEGAEERCGPVFEAIGGRTAWLGDAGAASRMKLVLNSWLLALVSGLAEAIALARALGLDPRRFLELIDGGPVDAPYAQLKGRLMIEADYPPAFPARLAEKDARLVLEAGRAAGVEPKVSETAQRLFARALALGHGDEDMAAVAEAIAHGAGERAGGH